MATQNEEWKNCIVGLLKEFGCASGWAAEEYTKGALSHGYITKMMYKGLVPQWPTAVAFLEHFRTNEIGKKMTAECLQAANLPIPADWQEKSADPVERVQIALNGIGVLEDYQIERIQELIQKHRKKPDA